MDWVGLYPQNMTFLCLPAMKRKLNLIATAASLVLLGLLGESQAYQTPQDSLVGSGIRAMEAVPGTLQPPVVRGDRKLISELKPLKMPLSKQAATQIDQLKTSVAEKANPFPGNGAFAPASSKSNARLPDTGVPFDARTNVSVPPIIKSSSRRLSQASGSFVPPVVKGNRPFQQTRAEVEMPPIVKREKPERVMPPIRTASSSSSFFPQGSSSRTALPPVESSIPTPPPSARTNDTTDSYQAVPTLPSAAAVPNGGAASVLESSGYFPTGPVDGQPVTGDPVFVDGGDCTTCGPVVGADGACSTCGVGLTDGVCPSCGPGAGFGNGPVIQDFGTFGSVSASRCYFHAESLIMTREDGDLFGANVAPLTNFDYAGGLRLTFGKKSDSIFGRELGIMALADVSEDVTTQNNLFLNVDFQSQNKESDIYSIEYNRVNWGWDLVKTFVGVKFLRFDDSYRISAASAARGPQVEQRDVFGNIIVPAQPGRPADSGFFSMDAVNSLFGAQVGGELFYDIGYRWSTSVAGKWGVFANISDFDTTTIGNTGSPLVSENNESTISTAAELNFLAHYQIRTNLRFKAGYNLLFVGNVATVSDNFTQQTPTLNGFNISDSDDVFFHGFSLGLEFYR